MAEKDSEVTSNIQEDCCVICNQGFEDEIAVCVSHKGILTLINFSEKRGQLDLMTYLTEIINKTPQKTVLVHKKCRRNFTDLKRGFNNRVTMLKHLVPKDFVQISNLSIGKKIACFVATQQ